METAGRSATAAEGAAIAALDRTALRARFREAFVPEPAIYWGDLLASASVGWASFAAAGLAPAGSGLALLAAALATLALYRAVLFIHELTHLPRGSVPGFEVAWHLVAGLPLLVPSLLYVGSHGDHHRSAVYGTPADPEYAPLAHWSPARIAATSLLVTLLPAALILRWGLFGPLSWLVPPLRRLVVAHASTLAINGAYRRRAPRGRTARRWALQEGAAALTVWGVAGGVASGAIAPRWLVLWYAVGTAILTLNHLRTLAAHRYENRGDTLDGVGQLTDSINLEGSPWLALAAPVGLRYHALHHLLPTLPYHRLGAVHRRLLAELAADSPYRATRSPGIGAALAGLLRRAADRARPPATREGEGGELSAARAGATAGTEPAIRRSAGAVADAR